MEFDTNSVWVIVITLLLITIFIIVWYFYQELLETKKRTKGVYENTTSIHDRLDGIERKISEFEDICSVSYDGNNNEQENCEEDSVEFNFDDREKEKIFKDLQEELLRDSNEDLCVNQQQEEPQEEQQEEIIEYVYETESETEEIQQLCCHILVSGKRKGMACEKPCQSGQEKCKTHI
jgi:hypothetical protein